MTPAPVWTLLRQRSFTLLWCSALVSWIGNGAMFIALPVYVYGRTGSTLATALSVLPGTLSSLLIGPLAGVWVDRWDKRRTLVAVNLALGGLTLALLALLGGSWWLLTPLLLARSGVSQLLGPAENALLLGVVGARLDTANGLNALGSNLARLLGPALGGVLLAWLGFAGVVVVDALSFLLAAALLLGVRAGTSADVSGSAHRAFWAEWRGGWRAVRRHPLLRLSLAAALLVGFGEGFVSTLMAPWLKVMLHGGGQALGSLMSVQALGGLAAGALLAHWGRRRGGSRARVGQLAWGGLLSGVLLLALLNYPLWLEALWPALALTAVAGLPFTAWGTAQLALVQGAAPAGLRGRVFALSFALFGGAQGLGTLLSGLLAQRLSVLLLNVDALTYLLSGLLALTFLRRLRRGRAPALTPLRPRATGSGVR